MLRPSAAGHCSCAGAAAAQAGSVVCCAAAASGHSVQAVGPLLAAHSYVAVPHRRRCPSHPSRDCMHAGGGKAAILERCACMSGKGSGAGGPAAGASRMLQSAAGTPATPAAACWAGGMRLACAHACMLEAVLAPDLLGKHHCCACRCFPHAHATTCLSYSASDGFRSATGGICGSTGL
jgi:hypothetical protein